MKRTLLLSCIVVSLFGFNAMALSNDAKSASQDATMGTEVQSTDAIQIILKDHAYIRQQLSQIKSKLDANYDEARSMFKNIQDFIIKHETMEQKAFYPALESNKNLSSIIADLKKEEDAAAKAIKQLDGITDKAQWVSKVKDIMKAVDQHATEEETKLFPKVRRELDQRALNDLGAKLNDFRSKNNMEIK